MKIHKLGHCCLVIEIKGKRIMTDPGAWSTLQTGMLDIDLVVITHEHQDHLHIESLKKVLENNPQAKIVTNTAVGAILTAENIPFTLVEEGVSFDFEGVLLRGHGDKHAPIIDMIEPVQNTGFTFDEELYYPGDAFSVPDKTIRVLALPVCGPWMHMSEAIDFVKKIKPQICFPVHDGMLKIIGPFHRVPAMALEKEGIQFVPMFEGEEHEF